MNQAEKRPSHRISLFFPLMLITVGIVLLWMNLSGQLFTGWGVILRLWPLLLIFGGLDGLVQHQGAAANTFWITFGLALLLSNFNRISWTAWEVLLSLWPVFLVALGVDLVIGRKTIWHQLVAGLVILLVMGGIAIFFDSGPRRTTSDVEKVEQNREGATQGVVHLEPLVGYLKVYAQGSQELLVQCNLQLWGGEKIHRSYEIINDTGTFTLASSGITFIYEPGINNRANWEIGVSSRIPISLKVNQAIGEVFMDFTELQTEKFDISLALGRSSIVLPSDRSLDGNVEAAMGEILIEVPEGTALAVTGKPAIGNVSAPLNYVRDGNRLISPTFAEGKERIEISIGLAIGQVIIRER